MISIIITSFTDFGDLTTPLINSLLRHEQSPEILVIDNGSKKPYPVGSAYRVHRFEEPVSWAKMLNTGAEIARGDWLMFLNDDVICLDPFVNMIEGLDKDGIYGPKLRQKPLEWGAGIQINYIPAWIFVMQKSIYNRVGGMDEWYPKVGMDDIDFCWRAEQIGIPLIAIDFPFIHLDQHRRNKWDGFKEQMEKSKAYFIEKIERSIK